MLVFSGPMCFECLDEKDEGAEDELESEGVGEEGANDLEAKLARLRAQTPC